MAERIQAFLIRHSLIKHSHQIGVIGSVKFHHQLILQRNNIVLYLLPVFIQFSCGIITPVTFIIGIFRKITVAVTSCDLRTYIHQFQIQFRALLILLLHQICKCLVITIGIQRTVSPQPCQLVFRIILPVYFRRVFFIIKNIILQRQFGFLRGQVLLFLRHHGIIQNVLPVVLIVHTLVQYICVW